MFTNNDVVADTSTGKATKGERGPKLNPRFNDFPSEIAPREGDWVLAKTKASGFFQTPLAAYLVRERVSGAGARRYGRGLRCVNLGLRASDRGGRFFARLHHVRHRRLLLRPIMVRALRQPVRHASEVCSVVSLRELEALMGPARVSSVA